MTDHSPHASARPPHPLAVALIARLGSHPGASILEIGRGSGRNTRALEAAGFSVITLDDTAVASAALSTHALLHGTHESLSQLLDRIAARVEPHAPLYVTFGCVQDARYGIGTRIEEDVFAPLDGDEAGVAHCYFTQDGVRALLERRWTIESIEDVAVDEIAGSWAHQERPLQRAVHWFVIARRRD